MGMRLKTKLSLGLGFLFVVILSFGVISLWYINRLSNDAENVLTNNHESLVYVNNMFKALEMLPVRKDALQLFDDNLKKQEANITEIGEGDATQELRKNFNELRVNTADPSNYPEIRQSLIRIQDINEMAILRKNAVAEKTADNAKLWLTIIFTVLTLVSFSFIFNLPGVIAGPIRSLADGIDEIANKNYGKRIYLKQEDEFGDLAHAFNTMAEKLDGYEHSSIAELQFEKSRIETIINQMRDGIIGLDTKKNILFLNVVAQQLLGVKEQDLVGKYAPDIALRNDLMRTLLQPGIDKKDLKIYADNKESYFNRDVLDVTSNNEVIGQVIVLRNITLFHELNEAKTNFIATVSHELKTPISSIKMSARLLTDERNGALDEGQRDLIHSIRDDADRLLKITGELLNMAQVETGNIQLRLQPTPPADIISQALQAVQFQAQQSGFLIRVQQQPAVPLITVDAEKTTWVLINLLTNAIKYSTPPATVEVDVQRKDGQVEFSVRDYGKGIEEKYLPRIFDRYFKVPGGLAGGGTGLGLAISREFIEAQGGSIRVASTPGEGSVFSFSFKI